MPPRDRDRLVNLPPGYGPVPSPSGDKVPMQPLANANGGGSMEEFLSEVDQVRQSITDLRTTTAQLATAHSHHLATTNEQDLAEITTRVHELTARTRELTSALRTRIIGMNERNRRASLGEEAYRVRRIHIGGLQKSFSQALGEYSLAEQKSRDAYRSRAERQFRIVKPDATPEEIGAALRGAEGGTQVLAQALVSSRQRGARTAFTEAQSRNADLQQLEKTITELGQLMNDMATMVYEQQDDVVDIERNAGLVEADVREGAVQVSRGKKLAAAARKNKWWLFGIFLTILGVVAIVVAVEVTK